MKTITVLIPMALLSLSLVSGCSNAGRGVCNKQSECCNVASACADIQKEGAGYPDRCDINYQAQLDKLGTWSSKLCDDIASKYDALTSCMAGVACVDVSSDGHVVKCDPQAADYCNAKKNSGDACGQDYRGLDCSKAQAKLF